MSFNEYIYVSNNFINNTDVDGNLSAAAVAGAAAGAVVGAPWSWIIGIGIAIGAIAGVALGYKPKTIAIDKNYKPAKKKSTNKRTKKDNVTKNQYVYVLA